MGVEGYGLHKEQGAGDQGMMFGYACTETDDFMPYPLIWLTDFYKHSRNTSRRKVMTYLVPTQNLKLLSNYDDKLQKS
jgi:S-adenosylmethionine synthetase